MESAHRSETRSDPQAFRADSKLRVQLSATMEGVEPKCTWSFSLTDDQFDANESVDFRFRFHMWNYIAAEKLFAFAMGLHPRLGAESAVSGLHDNVVKIGAILDQLELEYIKDRRMAIGKGKDGEEVVVGFCPDLSANVEPPSWDWASKMCPASDIRVFKAVHQLEQSQNLRYASSGFAKSEAMFGFSCQISVYLGTCAESYTAECPLPLLSHFHLIMLCVTANRLFMQSHKNKVHTRQHLNTLLSRAASVQQG